MTVLQGRNTPLRITETDRTQGSKEDNNDLDDVESFDSLGGVLVKGTRPHGDSMADLPEEIYLRTVYMSKYPQEVPIGDFAEDSDYGDDDDYGGATPNEYLDKISRKVDGTPLSPGKPRKKKRVKKAPKPQLTEAQLKLQKQKELMKEMREAAEKARQEKIAAMKAAM